MFIINVIKIKAKTRENGFTLIEIIVTLVLVGILASLGGPNLFSLLAKNDLGKGLEIMKNTLQNTQRQAIRRSKACKLELVGDNIIRDVTNYGSSTFKDCLSNAETETVTVGSNTMRQLKLPEGVKITSNLTGNSLEFSFQGMIIGNLTNTASQPATIVLTKTGTPEKKCIIISPIIGLIRIGNYAGNNNASGIVLNDTNPENSCQTRL